jgi:ribosomal protein S18 acetylase RimI-like enzyme
MQEEIIFTDSLASTEKEKHKELWKGALLDSNAFGVPDWDTFDQEAEEHWNRDFVSTDVYRPKTFFAKNMKGEILGTIRASVVKIPYQKRKHGRIQFYYVKQQFRGYKIGRTLMQKAEDYLKENGVQIINLNVMLSQKRAHKIYKKLKFKTKEICLDENNLKYRRMYKIL